MVIREDGTKWACQSCLKGHRVSGCTHTDRELTLVPKKGRPVTQCQHCRQERKKRSAHVRCDCGEVDKPHHPKEKCIHLREAEERAKAGFHEDSHGAMQASADENDLVRLAAVAEEQGCCCSHGGKCACSLVKKEPTRMRESSMSHIPAVHKPRLEPTRSDGSITVFANGHHKPVHRKNHAAHECGMPYKIPMPRTYSEQTRTALARRSVDSLAIDTRMPFGSAGFAAAPGTAPFLRERRLSKSEQHSPKCDGGVDGASGLRGFFDTDLSSIDFDTLASAVPDSALDSATNETMVFPPLDPMSGLADSNFDPWSTFPSGDSTTYPNNNSFGVWATTMEGHGPAAQPALTAASSGTQSEIDEMPTMDDLYPHQMPSIQEDMAQFEMDVTLSDDTANRRSLPPNFFGNTDFSLNNWGASDWQTPVGNVSSPDDNNKFKPSTSEHSPTSTQPWAAQSPISAMTSLPPRPAPASANNNPFTGRPQSMSVGNASAPPDDLIKQLFPDIDIDSTVFTHRGPSPADISLPKRADTLPMNISATGVGAGAAPADFLSGMNDDENDTATAQFAAQRWDDGSMTVPNDAYAPNAGFLDVDVDVDLNDPEFQAEWQA